MFSQCLNLIAIENFTNLNTEKTNKMYAMFQGCLLLTEINITNLNMENNKELLFNGEWKDNLFNIDNASVGNKVTVKAIKVKNKTDTTLCIK